MPSMKGLRVGFEHELWAQVVTVIRGDSNTGVGEV
jgi:hypothetical protein